MIVYHNKLLGIVANTETNLLTTISDIYKILCTARSIEGNVSKNGITVIR